MLDIDVFRLLMKSVRAGCNRLQQYGKQTLVSDMQGSTGPVQAHGAYLVESHLHSKALIVYVGDSRSIHIQQDEAVMVCDDAAPLAVNLI